MLQELRLSLSPQVPSPKKPPVAKAKGTPAIKGIVEETAGPAGSVAAATSTAPELGSPVQEALLAEAAKILKGVSLKACQLKDSELAVEGSEELEVDLGWLVSAVTSASDHSMALVNSGATTALRPAREGELSTALCSAPIPVK